MANAECVLKVYFKNLINTIILGTQANACLGLVVLNLFQDLKEMLKTCSA